MFKNYIKIAFRNLKNNPFITAINVFGLAIGVAGGLLITLYIVDELSYDQMFTDADQIYRIDTDIKFGGAAIKSAESAPPMAAAIKNDFAEVEQTLRFRDQGEILIRRQGTVDNTTGSDATYVDANFLQFFGLQLVSGNEQTALEKANTVILTKSVAQKHFGDENAINKSIILRNKDTHLVTGVIEDLPKNSFLRNHGIFMAMDGNHASKENVWGSMNYYTFVKLRKDANLEVFQKKVAGILETYMLPWAQKVFPGMTAASFAASGDYINYFAIPLTDIYLYSDRQDEMSETSSIQNVYILTFIGLFLIALACVNFMNLSTAHSLKRAKEVGIRKTLGSNKFELIRQFLVESGLVSVISIILAILVVVLTIPYFNDLAGKNISLPLNKSLFWIGLLATTIILGLISGSYPAFFLSKFNPVDTLKGDQKNNIGGSSIRNVLVVFQFSVSVALIIGTLVVYQQLRFIQNKDLGYAKEQVLLIDNAFSAGEKLDAFKDNVKTLSTVQNATISSQMPTPSDRSNSSYFLEGKTNADDALQMQEWYVDTDYAKTLNLNFVAGRDFDESSKTDELAVIINEANLTTMGLDVKSAIGKRISQIDEGDHPDIYTIIGVVQNFHYASLRDDIGALALFNKKSTGMMAIKLNTENYRSTVGQIEQLWKDLAPGQPFDYSFMDDDFNNTYSADVRLGKVFMVFSCLSIFIACLGLFGLASYNAQKHIKEIGVRKVLGATVSQITIKLTFDFLKLVFIAALVALPIGWFAMNAWLKDFSYRISVDWKILLFATLIVVVIAILTVSYQSIKAAMANPIKSLRSE